MQTEISTPQGNSNGSQETNKPPRPVGRPNLPLPNPDQIAAAKAHLNKMPLDVVPAPAPLPAGSRMPWPENKRFVGRESELLDLAGVLHSGQMAAIGQFGAAGRFGGVGKTTMAVAFAYRYGQFFVGGVHWINCKDPDQIETEFASLLQSGLDGLSQARYDLTTLPLVQQTNIVRQRLRLDIPRLLIFDNCEDPGILELYAPEQGGSRVLITSTQAEWPASIYHLPLRSLPRGRSVTLLGRYAALSDATQLTALAGNLGDMPLALHLVGSVIQAGGGGPEGDPAAILHALGQDNLLQQLVGPKEPHPNLPRRGYDGHAARAFAVALLKLKPKDRLDTLANQLLARAACFAPGYPIPLDLLFSSLKADALDLNYAIQRVVALGLLEQMNGEQVRMHPMLVAFLQALQRGDLAPGALWVEYSTARAGVETAVRRALHRINATDDFAAAQPWLAHAWHVTRLAAPREDTAAAWLCTEMGNFLRSVGNLLGAQPLFERAAAINTNVLGNEHPHTASSLMALGQVLELLGERDTARAAYEHALDIREKALGTDHPETVATLKTLALLLDAMGFLHESRAYYDRALSAGADDNRPQNNKKTQKIRPLGDDDRYPTPIVEEDDDDFASEWTLNISEQTLGLLLDDSGGGLTSMATLFNAVGLSGDARPFYERALEQTEKLRGADHPETATSHVNLARLLHQTGEHTEALPHLQRALGIRLDALGPEHPDTAESRKLLGQLMTELGDFEHARPNLEAALATDVQVLGAEHPTTAQSQFALGKLLLATGDVANAESLLQTALATRQKRLGFAHPDTALSLTSIGELHLARGENDAAHTCFEKALIIRETVLGAEHPEALASVMAMGELLRSQGHVAAALPYFERAVVVSEQAFGNEHTRTADAHYTLSVILKAQKDNERAIEHMERAVAIRKQVLTSDHPDTLNALNNLGLLLQAQKRFDDARPYLEQAAVITERLYTAEHPATAAALNNLGRLLRDLGQLDAARPPLERAVVIRQQTLGQDHPETASSLNNLAVVCYQLGDYEKAAVSMQRAVAIRSEKLGPEHPDTLNSRRSLEVIARKRQASQG